MTELGIIELVIKFNIILGWKFPHSRYPLRVIKGRKINKNKRLCMEKNK